MPVIDVDSHFEPTSFPPGDHPLWELRDQLPAFADVMVANLAGDLYRAMPPDQRPDPASLLPRIGATMGMSPEQVDDLVASAPPPQTGAADAPERVAWMDRIGIDYSFVNPGGAYAGSVASSNQFFDDPEIRHRAMILCNDYLADNFAPYTSRVSPVAILDFDALEWSIAEMERMRGRGSRGTSCGPHRSRAVHPRIPRPTGSGVRPPTSEWSRSCTSATPPLTSRGAGPTRAGTNLAAPG